MPDSDMPAPTLSDVGRHPESKMAVTKTGSGNNSSFCGRHFGFQMSADVWQCRRWHVRVGHSPKCGGSRWNLICSCNTNRDNSFLRWFPSIFLFSSRHIGFLEGVIYGLKAPSCSQCQFIFRKSRKGASINSKRFGNGSKNSGLGVNLPPPHSVHEG